MQNEKCIERKEEKMKERVRRGDVKCTNQRNEHFLLLAPHQLNSTANNNNNNTQTAHNNGNYQIGYTLVG
jgi:hypothetical protein